MALTRGPWTETPEWMKEFNRLCYEEKKQNKETMDVTRIVRLRELVEILEGGGAPMSKQYRIEYGKDLKILLDMLHLG